MARTKRKWHKTLHKNGYKKQDGVKYYIPNGDLVTFLGRQLHRRKDIEAGVEWSKEDEGKRNNNIDRLKVSYLDKHIFPAMANLAFFFEVIAKHPELEKIYEDDIKDLLGIRRKKASDKSGFMFYNLLYNILKVSGSPFERKEIVKDFRLILTHCAEEIVRMKVRRSLPSGQYSKGGKLEINSNEANIHGLVLENFDRALSLTWMLAADVYKSQDVEDSPHRTFDFDTEELLGIKKEKEKNAESTVLTLDIALTRPPPIIPGIGLRLNGTLTYTVTGSGISGATIAFTGTGVPPRLSGVTDPSGRYLAVITAPLLPGTYTIQAHFAGLSIFGPSNSGTQTFTVP